MPAPIIRPPTKICRVCLKELNKEEHFYKGGYRSYQSKCKPCFNAYSVINMRKHRAKKKAINPPKKRNIGFFKLPQETQDIIRNKIKDGGKIKTIAREHDITYGSLYTWHRKGLINQPTTE